MKLKQHREDVKSLIELGSKGYGQLDYIAKRYLNLIRAFEELDDYLTSYDMTFRTKREQRVLNDGEVKK